jgi:hypothetical protein
VSELQGRPALQSRATKRPCGKLTVPLLLQQLAHVRTDVYDRFRALRHIFSYFPSSFRRRLGMPVAMTTFKSKSKRTDLSPQDLPTIPTVQEMTTWDEAALLQWIQQEKPKLDKFTAAGFLGETFLRRAGDVEYNGPLLQVLRPNLPCEQVSLGGICGSPLRPHSLAARKAANSGLKIRSEVAGRPRLPHGQTRRAGKPPFGPLRWVRELSLCFAYRSPVLAVFIPRFKHNLSHILDIAFHQLQCRLQLSPSPLMVWLSDRFSISSAGSGTASLSSCSKVKQSDGIWPSIGSFLRRLDGRWSWSN